MLRGKKIVLCIDIIKGCGTSTYDTICRDHTESRKIYNSGNVGRRGRGSLENLDASRVVENLVGPVIYQRETYCDRMVPQSA